MSQENYLKALSQYDKVDKFHEGLAIVCKDNKFGMIDTDAEEVIPCEYNKLYPCSEGIIKFRSFDNPLYGFIDKNNKKITEAIYTDARKGGLTPELRPMITIMFVGILILLIIINLRKIRNSKSIAE